MRVRLRLLVLWLPLLLVACGGSLFIGFGANADVDPPSVSLAAAANTVQAGATLKLFAAASDSGSGIEEVAFYRLDGNSEVRLGSDGTAPYEWSLLVPNDGRTTLRVFARATDGAGNRADSALVTVTVTP
jgi:hypothetical protein